MNVENIKSGKRFSFFKIYVKRIDKKIETTIFRKTRIDEFSNFRIFLNSGIINIKEMIDNTNEVPIINSALEFLVFSFLSGKLATKPKISKISDIIF